MTNQEAKFILASYRPNGIDANDPLFTEALKQAQSDPALAAWLAREQAHAVAVADKLRQVVPPPDLRERILAGGRISTRPIRKSKILVWLPLAVAAALAVGVSVFWWQRPAGGPQPLVAFAIGDLASKVAHEEHGPETGPLQAALADSTRPLQRPLPIDFAALAKGGCRTLSLSGHPILEVCFQRNGTWYHCYIARAADFPGDVEAHAPLFASESGISTVAWADGLHRIVVASTAGQAALERLL